MSTVRIGLDEQGRQSIWIDGERVPHIVRYRVEQEHHRPAAVTLVVRAESVEIDLPLAEVLQLPRQDQRPHSRACGVKPHEHGLECHPNCPTCGAAPGAGECRETMRTSPNYLDNHRHSCLLQVGHQGRSHVCPCGDHWAWS